MERCSTSNAEFLSHVARWLDADREVFVVVRFPNAGGAKSYEHFTMLSALTERISQLSPSTSVLVCKGTHLPLRGIVDDDFISVAVDRISDNTEWLIVRETIYTCGAASWFPDSVGDTHEELVFELRDETYFGHPVRFGVAPPCWEGDSDTIISAYIPNADGSITPAAY